MRRVGKDRCQSKNRHIHLQRFNGIDVTCKNTLYFIQCLKQILKYEAEKELVMKQTYN